MGVSPGGQLTTAAPPPPPAPASEWEEFEDDEGRKYYHNAATGETSWTPPEEAGAGADADAGAKREKLVWAGSACAELVVDVLVADSEVTLDAQSLREPEGVVQPPRRRGTGRLAPAAQ